MTADFNYLVISEIFLQYTDDNDDESDDRKCGVSLTFVLYRTRIGVRGFTHGQAGNAQPEVDRRKSPKNAESPQNPPFDQSLKTLKTTTEGSALDEGGGNVFV